MLIFLLKLNKKYNKKEVLFSEVSAKTGDNANSLFKIVSALS